MYAPLAAIYSKDGPTVPLLLRGWSCVTKSQTLTLVGVLLLHRSTKFSSIILNSAGGKSS
jgi:hypothetical protein